MKHPKRDPRGKPSLPEAGTEQGWAGFTRTSKGCVSQAAARQERRAVLPHAARQGGCQPNKHFCLVLPPSPSLHCLNTSKGGQENQSVWSTRSGPPRPGGSSRWIWRDSQTPRVPSSASLSASLEITSRIQLSHSSSLIPSWSQPLFLTWATELASIHFPSFSFFIYLLFKGFFLWCRPFFKKTIEFITALLIVLFIYLFFWPQFMWDFDSLSRDWTHILCVGWWNLSRWTTRKVPAPALFFYSMYDP